MDFTDLLRGQLARESALDARDRALGIGILTGSAGSYGGALPAIGQGLASAEQSYAQAVQAHRAAELERQQQMANWLKQRELAEYRNQRIEMQRQGLEQKRDAAEQMMRLREMGMENTAEYRQLALEVQRQGQQNQLSIAQMHEQGRNERAAAKAAAGGSSKDSASYYKEFVTPDGSHVFHDIRTGDADPTWKRYEKKTSTTDPYVTAELGVARDAAKSIAKSQEFSNIGLGEKITDEQHMAMVRGAVNNFRKALGRDPIAEEVQVMSDDIRAQYIGTTTPKTTIQQSVGTNQPVQSPSAPPRQQKTVLASEITRGRSDREAIQRIRDYEAQGYTVIDDLGGTVPQQNSGRAVYLGVRPN